MHNVCHAVDRMGDKRVLSKCATAVRLCAACAVHVRHPTMSSQRARTSTAGKTPSFRFCQVDMYAFFLLILMRSSFISLDSTSPLHSTLARLHLYWQPPQLFDYVPLPSSLLSVDRTCCKTQKAPIWDN